MTNSPVPAGPIGGGSPRHTIAHTHPDLGERFGLRLAKQTKAYPDPSMVWTGRP
jgi:hypothetical protein